MKTLFVNWEVNGIGRCYEGGLRHRLYIWIGRQCLFRIGVISILTLEVTNFARPAAKDIHRVEVEGEIFDFRDEPKSAFGTSPKDALNNQRIE